MQAEIRVLRLRPSVHAPAAANPASVITATTQKNSTRLARWRAQ